MSTYEEAKDAEIKNRREISTTEKIIPAELNRLKESTLDLARNVKSISAHKTQAANDYMYEIASDIKSSGSDALRKTESYIREKPGQSVGMAFAVGMLTSILLRRRRG